MSFQTQQFQPKTCANCQRSNAAFALICVHCGATLSAPEDNPIVMAELLAARLKVIAQQVSTTYADELAGGALVLYIPANDAAIVLEHSRQVVLGRMGTGTDSTQHDLTPYNAYTLGVSRRHARVASTRQGYALTDLGSANGTWANSRRLAANAIHYLQNSDQVWLGQLILLAYVAASPWG